MTGNMEAQIKEVVTLINQATNIVALTGAGISTPSGIPDFRSPNSGLWTKHNPMEVASILSFRQYPEEFYEWVAPLTQKVRQAKPNSAHDALTILQKQGKLNTIITQNIDGLHQAAGSDNVLEVHGHIRQLTCIRCYNIIDASQPIIDTITSGKVPYCSCRKKGVLKPNVILFGEQLPVQTLLEAKQAMSEADLILVVGSSLEVAPIADFPSEAKKRGAKVVIINYLETFMDAEADVVIRANVTDVLPQLMALMPVVAG